MSAGKPSAGAPSASALVPPPPPPPPRGPMSTVNPGMTDAVPPPPPARPNQNRGPACAAGQPGVPAVGPSANAEGNAPGRPGAGKTSSPSPPLPTATAPKESLLPKSWEPLVLPPVSSVVKPVESTTVVSSGLGATSAGKTGGGGIAPGDLAPYGEAGLSVALSAPPERLRRRVAEANPFDERLLVPAEAARKLREAVTQLSSLANEVGPAGREAEVR